MYRLSILLTILLLAYSFIDADAQRRTTTYQSLLQRTDQPSSYIDHIVTPVSDSTAQFTVFYRLDYDFIPFLRLRPDMNPPSPEAEYFAPVRMGVEIFEGAARRNQRRSSNAISVFRDSWQDTVWVDTFEETESRFDYTQGYVRTVLPKGDYHYELQLTRGGSVREQSSNSRNLTIPEYSSYEETTFMLMQNIDQSNSQLSADLLNYSNNVLYGQDYTLLFKIPQNLDVENENVFLTINRLSVAESESGEERFSEQLTKENLIRLREFNLNSKDNTLSLQADIHEDGFLYAIVDVPNQDFENSRYKIHLTKEDTEKPIASRDINSQWLDMPVSLYNLDVAIDMLKFILPDDELRQLNSGSAAEKEQKFREFWKQRDPTPNTEFNELMTEYYRRIDHSFKSFSSIQIPGFETDQGNAYIKFGPPDNIERQLPTNAPTREIWEYRNRTLIFEATTGFGDFKLISETTR